MLSVTVKDGARALDHRRCLLHQSQYEVIDDWQVLGMRSTGSMTVAAQNVFVPEYKTLSMVDTRGGDRSPGVRTNPNPVYQVPANPLLGHGLPQCCRRRMRCRQCIRCAGN
jgi:hypothetical protein